MQDRKIEYDENLEFEVQEAINQLKGIKREPIVREEVKVGRNEPCPCGSGLKNKKCCNTK